MGKAKATPKIDSALHVVKGAIVQVLETPLTLSVSYKNAKQARVSVEYKEAVAPTEDQIKQITDLANDCIKKGLPITDNKTTKEEARKEFGDVVKNTSLFDRMEPKVDDINVVLIPDWTVNCCAGPHLASTSEIGEITITRVNHRPQKNECEFVVEFANSKGAEPAKKKNKWETKKKAAVVEEPIIKQMTQEQLNNANNVNILSKEIIQMILADSGIEKSKADEISTKNFPLLKAKLTTLKNTSYAQGFASSKQ